MPHRRRTLSPEAREAISEAQRKRWRLAKQKSRKTGESVLNVKTKGKLKPGQTTNPGGAMKAYWARMSDAERSREVKRRRLVREGKLKPKHSPTKTITHSRVLPRGFWQAEMTKLLADGPRPRAEIHDILLKRLPHKENAITVAFAALKRDGVMSEAGGILTLAAK